MPDTTIFFQKRVGWTRYTFISVFLIINFILNLIVSLPTIPTTWKLSGIRSTSSVESPSVVPGEINQVVEIGIIVGPAGGCMSFGDQRTCAYTMNLQPSAEFWHLPSNQNVTNHFPSGKLMISCHFTTAVQALATTSYLIGPFKPGFFLVGAGF
ncbi:uncharacterized protein L201_002984 [Kwoniella dendrophila CBS 6074]|uniref:Uncharacterized protein n=1 Tax=Kwoniella dendrophila CBS 6074 TaxID=1295534 RepID=A0AAX4JU56_9TREE